MSECCRPSTSLVVRWEETGSKGHLALRKGHWSFWLTEGSLGNFYQ